jgi:hypothetical protein
MWPSESPVGHAEAVGAGLIMQCQAYCTLTTYALLLPLQVGVGCFQWTARAVCGLANAADAVKILGLSLVLPAAEDDLHLTPAGKSALSSCIFVGVHKRDSCFLSPPGGYSIGVQQ